MACITLLAPALTMATTQFTRALPYPQALPRERDGKMDHTALRMNWIVATDDNGSRRLRVHWKSAAVDA